MFVFSASTSAISLLLSAHVDAATTLSFTELATHPQASAQSTDQGKTLNNLRIFDGKLFAAYGDYNANTGPIDINPFDLNSGTFDGVALSVPSEALGTWKEINGKLYTPTIDPTCSGTCSAGYAVYTPGSGWEMQTPVNAEHIFDIETLTGTDIWLFGSAGGATSTAWRSTDGGANFSVAQTYENEPGSDNTERYYWGAAMDGKMYMQSDYSGHQNPVQIFDGTNWTTGTTDLLCRVGNGGATPRSVVFAGRIVCSDSGQITKFDGSSVTQQSWYTTPSYPGCNSSEAQLSIYNNSYYALCRFWNGNGGYDPATLIKSNDLASFSTLEGLPSSAASFALDIDTQKIYVGTTDSKIYVADLPPQDNTAPEVSLTSPTSGATLNQSYINLRANATDAQNGIARVEFYVDDQLVGTDYDAPYSANWRNQYSNGQWQYPSGAYQFSAKAYDTEGNGREGDVVSVMITTPNDIEITEYQTGLNNSNIAIDDQDNVWLTDINFGSGGVNGMHKLNPSSGLIEDFSIPDGETFTVTAFNDMIYARNRLWVPDCQAEVVKAYVIDTQTIETYNTSNICTDSRSTIVADSSGVIYVARTGDTNVIHKIDTNGDVSEIELPQDYGLATMTVDSQDRLVINFVYDGASTTSGVAYLSETGEIDVIYEREFDVNDVAALLYSQYISVAPNGDVWLGTYPDFENAFDYPLLTRINSQGAVTRTENETGSLAGRLLSGNDNGLWFVQSNGLIGKLNNQSNSPNLYSGIVSLLPDGFLGDAEETALFNEYYIGFYSGSNAIDSNNNLWVSDGMAGRIVKLTSMANSVNQDSDSDGTLDSLENAGPNSGDANGDGIPDSTQANVTSLIYDNSNYMVLETACTTNFNVQNGLESNEYADPAYEYPAGLVGFVGLDCGSPGSTVEVKLYYYGNLNPDSFVLRKWQDSMYTTIPNAVLTSTTIGGQSVLRASYTVQDGGDLDQDHQADGNIVDPVGLASNVAGSPNTGQDKHWLLGLNQQ